MVSLGALLVMVIPPYSLNNKVLQSHLKISQSLKDESKNLSFKWNLEWWNDYYSDSTFAYDSIHPASCFHGTVQICVKLQYVSLF